MNAAELLPMTLALAVPLWIDQLHGTSHIHRRARAHHCIEILAHYGEGALFLVPTKGGNVGSAEAFNRLAEALAIGAYQPAGIRAFGIHWCAIHHPGGVKQDSQVCQQCLDEEAA